VVERTVVGRHFLSLKKFFYDQLEIRDHEQFLGNSNSGSSSTHMQLVDHDTV
jgi:hypothetical protein